MTTPLGSIIFSNPAEMAFFYRMYNAWVILFKSAKSKNHCIAQIALVGDIHIHD
jgi:hypothetical protein